MIRKKIEKNRVLIYFGVYPNTLNYLQKKKFLKISVFKIPLKNPLKLDNKDNLFPCLNLKISLSKITFKTKVFSVVTNKSINFLT